MSDELNDLVGMLKRQVIHNLEQWEASSPDPHALFVGMAGGQKTKSIHDIVEDVRKENAEGQELLGRMLRSMMDQAMETQFSEPPPPFDAAAFEAELDAARGPAEEPPSGAGRGSLAYGEF